MSEVSLLEEGAPDDGAVVGVDDGDGTVLRVTNAIRDSIRPDVTMFVLCEARELEGKTVVAVKVQKMIRETGVDDHETTRSLKQELTFFGAEKAFREENPRHHRGRRCLFKPWPACFRPMRTHRKGRCF